MEEILETNQAADDVERPERSFRLNFRGGNLNAMRTYETMFITAPTVAPDAYDRLVGTFEELISTNGGNVTNTVKWGRRTLAYEIQKFKEGIYTIFEFEAPGEMIKELERRMRLNDSVLKFLTVKTERKAKLEAKGSEKRQAKQNAKAKRKARKVGTEDNRRDDRRDERRDERR